MSREIYGLSVVFFIGLTLVFAEFRWFQRVGLAERLDHYTPKGKRKTTGVLSGSSFREVVVPLAHAIGERVSSALRVGEELSIRLERIHSPIGVAGYRVRQVGWAATSFGSAVIISMIARLPAVVSMGLVLGAPLLAFLVLEQRTISASNRWQRRLRMELPVMTEQMAMLVSAGWSLGASMARISKRGTGLCSKDLKMVLARIRQGLSEVEALREWAKRADIDPLYRLVSVLSLNSEATDLGKLISEETRAMRREAQRELIESIERRCQQVWIPVTAATLVPGVMLMSVPFINALTLFSM